MPALLMNKYLLPAVAASFAIASGTAAIAGTYEALCNGTKCTVYIDASSIRSPYGSIRPQRVTDWGGGGDSKTSLGTGVATTVLLGPVGLLGFLAKNHDFNFIVNGYDDSGRKVSLNVQFKNDKPAKKFINELQVVTGLGMGQVRTAKEIMAAESAGGIGSTGTLKGDAQAESALREPQVISNPKGNCWTAYLDANPAMKAWSEANPAMAEQNKKNFDDC